ncbi:MAG: penicillin-binding transpeptidase domain-containing protein, partial [Clostridia bacterium]
LKREKGEEWYDGQTIAAAIGQSDTLVTPIQLANYVSTLCNGGTRYEPHLLKSVKNPLDNSAVMETSPKVVGNVSFQKENLDAVLRGMHLGAQSAGGTAAAVFKNYPVSVATKTGSAQAPGGSHALFVAYAPVENPEIAIAIVVENGGQGSRIASVARDVLDVYFSNDFDLEQRQAENTPLK